MMNIEGLAKCKGIKNNDNGAVDFEISTISFSSSTALKSLMRDKKVTADNQILSSFDISMPLESFDLMQNFKRFSGVFILLIVNNQGVTEAWELKLGNFEIEYNYSAVSKLEDIVVINRATITVFPVGLVTCRKIEDE